MSIDREIVSKILDIQAKMVETHKRIFDELHNKTRSLKNQDNIIEPGMSKPRQKASERAEEKHAEKSSQTISQTIDNQVITTSKHINLIDRSVQTGLKRMKRKQDDEEFTMNLQQSKRKRDLRNSEEVNKRENNGMIQTRSKAKREDLEDGSKERDKRERASILKKIDNFKLVETGRCELPLRLDSGRWVKTNEAKQLLHSILNNRFARKESPDGKSYYILRNELKSSDSNATVEQICMCYGNDWYKHNCPVKFKFEYNLSTHIYKLSMSGVHNHKFDRRPASSQMSESMRIPNIEIITSKLDSIFDRPCTSTSHVKQEPIDH